MGSATLLRFRLTQGFLRGLCERIREPSSVFLLGHTWQGQAGAGAPGLEGLKGSVPRNLTFSPEGLWLSASEVPCVLFAN